MGKFSDANRSLFSVFNGAAWKAENLRIFPSDFKGEKGSPPYLTYTVVPSGAPLNASSISGVLLVVIYTAWGEGPLPSSEIADTLDRHLQHRTIGQTQLFMSSADAQERDKDDPQLSRTLYSVPFAHFGVN